MDNKSAFFLVLCFVGVSVLAAGCTTQTPPLEQSTELLVTGTNPPVKESDQTPGIEKDTSAFDFIEITIHNITVQNPGAEVQMVTFDVSFRNDGIPGDFSIDHQSLFLIAMDYPDQVFMYPKTENLPEGSMNTLVPVNLSPGQETRGTVVFPIREHVHSAVLYVKYPNWTIAGEKYIPEIANGALPGSDQDYPKTLGMSVDSAVQMKTIPGMNLRSGAKIAIINVSITNHADSAVTIRREQLFIRTERGATLEHGGDRVTREMAAQYLRFPLDIQPGETLSGPVLYVIYSGTRTNKLVLMDNNCVFQSVVDLNTIYRYD